MPKRRPAHRSTRINPMAARLSRAASDPTALPPPKPSVALPATSDMSDQERLDGAIRIATGIAPPAVQLVGTSKVDESIVDKGTAQPPQAGDSPMVRASGAYTVAGQSMFSFRLRLRGTVAAKYETAARHAACDPEEVMEATLVRQADRLSTETPLTFSDEERRSIIESLGTADPESIVRHIRNLVSATAVTVNGTPVSTLHFTSQQLERVASRCAAGETLTSKLQEYCDYGVNLQTGLA